MVARVPSAAEMEDYARKHNLEFALTQLTLAALALRPADLSAFLKERVATADKPYAGVDPRLVRASCAQVSDEAFHGYGEREDLNAVLRLALLQACRAGAPDPLRFLAENWWDSAASLAAALRAEREADTAAAKLQATIRLLCV